MEFRHLLLVIVILAAPLLAVPSVYSLFTGQHNFYDRGTYSCLKCHSDIQQEMDYSAYHASFTCENCHVPDANSKLTHGGMIDPGCLDCHGSTPRIVKDSNNNTFLSPVAKVFGENITNIESHIPFIESANSIPFMKGENEACISCHTTKSLGISMLYADTYKFNASRMHDSTWQLSGYSKNTELALPAFIQANGSAGIHSFPAQVDCEKCHSNIRDELNNSLHHTYFSCTSCHQIYSTYHASSTPPCLDCHGTSPKVVTDQKGSTFIASKASVYAENNIGADAHIPFVLSANNSGLSTGNNIACSSCHSSFNNNISFIRPEFIEWDVVNSSGTWTIQNLTFGPNKEIRATKYLDGKSHNTSTADCISCHEDIMQAVSNGGHSNEQWKHQHDYANYSDMNSYCQSCHRPVTQNTNGISPYPESPFNSPVHSAVQISCMDCHGKADISVYIDGAMRTPAYSGMNGIETSIAQQPAFVRSYLCIACKNTGNPVPNNLLHFKLYTEPQVTIYVNGTQQYP